ncbi:hypothetical protein ACFFTM_03750 [Pseudoduganella plicata]|uniref:Uncharacterized protein n=1 Tax=Pseudoduganella plicata TaxID=321984 RepID=A0A4P7BG15_9BURK|nr:hypothetical protein [Pseudoduganella plicata]QBQ36937.1 hypothetical protein E1742_12740 [Pseudoduganella plicata]GGZ07775.1 hypothetical protein GCM10007388_46590 [Pseudoduganella plicata]
MKRLFGAALLAASLASSPVHAEPSGASYGLSYLSGFVVLGSIAMVGGGGSVIVESVKTVGEGIEVVLKNVADASTATVRLSGKGASKLAIGASTALDVVATSTGHMLVASGKVLAFIPNELGKALLHHSEVGA